MTTKDKVKPVAWRIFRGGRWSYADLPSKSQEDRAAWQPLHAHPSQFVGLTELEIDDVQTEVDCRLYRSYARAIEAKLKEKNVY